MPPYSELEKWQDPRFLDPLIKPYYRDDLDYHNYPHAIHSSDRAIEIGQVAIAHGVDIKIHLLPSAGRLHDAGFHLRPLIDHPFATKEEYPADLASRLLKPLGMKGADVAHVSHIIESTAADVPCETATAKCFRQADLDNLVRGPVVFLNATYRLYKESRRLEVKPLLSVKSNPVGLMNDFIKFAGISHEILSTYLEEDVSLGEFDRDREGRSLFALKAAKNIGILVPNRLTEFLADHLVEVVNYQPIGI